MKIGGKIIRTQYLVDKRYQVRHIVYVGLIIFVSCMILGYLVYLGSWAYAVNKTLQSVNLYPGEHLTLVTKTFLIKSATFILVLSLVFACLWSLLFSHKIAGPALRFKKTLDEIASGRKSRIIKLRKGDYLKDLASSFNTTLESIESRNESQLTLIHKMQKELQQLIQLTQSSTPSESEIKTIAQDLASNMEHLQKLSSTIDPPTLQK
ncbi:methyl-accepting chemotaxis protein [PVC group bacterium]|nr:methyl-accepting chemotaxis protein [PVC group bacterium]